MTSNTKRILRVTGILCGLVAALYVGGSIVFSMVVRSRLQKMVATHLNAELKMASVRYHFPYGVTVSDASLVSPGPDGTPVELFGIRRLELRLAKLPVGSGPLVIERLTLGEPSLRLVRTRDGIVGRRGLVRTPEAQSPGEKMAAAADKIHDEKLSDIFRLRKFAIDNGQVVYEDRTQPHSVPMVWKGLEFDVNTVSHSGAIYDYDLTAKNAPLADVTAAGSLDVDELVLVVKNIGLKLTVSPDVGQSPLPGRVQRFLRDEHFSGVLRVSATGRVPLRRPADTEYDARVNLEQATASPQREQSLQRLAATLQVTSHAPPDDQVDAGPVKTSVAVEPAALGVSGGMPEAPPLPVNTGRPTTRRAHSPPVFVAIERIEAGTGDTGMRVDRGSVSLDPEEGTWHARRLVGNLAIGSDYRALPTALRRVFEKIQARGRLDFTAAASGPLTPPAGTRAVDSIKYEMLAQARDASIHLPHFPVAHEKLTGGLHILPGMLRLENVEARYGADHWFVTSMRIPLNDPDRDLRLQGINGSIEFAENAPRYPATLGKVLDVIHPGGVYQISGWYLVKAKASDGEKVDYQFEVASDRATLSPTTRWLPLTRVRVEMTVKSDRLEVRRVDASAVGGRVVASGQVRWPRGQPVSYLAKAQAADLDMKEFAGYWADGGTTTRMSGKGNLNAAIAGSGPDEGRTTLDNLTARGEFEILGGDFWHIPVLEDVVGGTKVSGDALTVGQAAGFFNLAKQRVTFDEIAVSAPALGVQGSGWVGFDGQIEAELVAAPLADWRDKLKSTGIPVVSDAVGEVAGGIQKLLNTATSNLLYEFRVTGKVQKPKVVTVPSPVLSDIAASLFGNMLNPSKEDRLLKALPSRPTTPPE